MTGKEFVPLKEEWLPGLMEIEKESFGADAWSENMFRSGMKQKNSHFDLLVQGDLILGYVGYLIVLDEMEILTVAVHPMHRKRGIGTALLQHLLVFAQRNGAMRILLEVRASNHPAVKLYESFGFHAMGVRRKYYKNPVEDAILYEWTGGNKDAVGSSI